MLRRPALATLPARPSQLGSFVAFSNAACCFSVRPEGFVAAVLPAPPGAQPRFVTWPSTSVGVREPSHGS
jgi:hypothetical protein